MNSRAMKIASLLLLVLLLAGFAAAATPAQAAGAPKPKSVVLDQRGTITIPLGTPLTLNATLLPAGAQSTLRWSSSKRKVATVSGGVVTPKKAGTTTITVTTGNKKKAKVKVKVIDPYKPASIHFDAPGPRRVPVYGKLQLNAVMSPATAQSKLKWKSSNKRVASVNANGVVTAHIPGKATITVTTRNKKKAKIVVRVYDDGQQPITTTPDYKLPYVIYACKKSHTIAIIARDAAGAWTRVIRTFPTGIGRNPKNTDVGTFFLKRKERWHRWGSGYSPYANRITVGLYLHGPIFKGKNHHSIRPNYYNCIGTNCSSGCLRTTTACAGWIYYNCPKGTQIIIAQNSRFHAPRPPRIGKKAKKDPTDPGKFEILMTSFSVTPGAMTLNQGAAQGIAVGNFGPAGTTTSTFTFASTNPGVATVSPAGIVTGVGGGYAEIVVTANDDYQCTAVIPVTVIAAPAPEPESAPGTRPADEESVMSAAPATDTENPAADAMIAGTEALEADEAEADGEAEAPEEDFYFDEAEEVTEDLSEVLTDAPIDAPIEAPVEEE